MKLEACMDLPDFIRLYLTSIASTKLKIIPVGEGDDSKLVLAAIAARQVLFANIFRPICKLAKNVALPAQTGKSPPDAKKLPPTSLEKKQQGSP